MFSGWRNKTPYERELEERLEIMLNLAEKLKKENEQLLVFGTQAHFLLQGANEAFTVLYNDPNSPYFKNEGMSIWSEGYVEMMTTDPGAKMATQMVREFEKYREFMDETS